MPTRRQIGGLLLAALLVACFVFVELAVLTLGAALLLGALGAHLWLLAGWRGSYRADARSWPWLAAAGAALAVAGLAYRPAIYAAALAVGLVAVEVWLRLANIRRPVFVPTRDVRQFVGHRQPDRFADPPRPAWRALPVGRWLRTAGGYALVFLIPLALTIALWTFRTDLPYYP